MCMKMAKAQKQGPVGYVSNAGLAGFKKFFADSPFAKTAPSCAVFFNIQDVFANMTPKDPDYCSKIPSGWRQECLDRMFMEKPKVAYTQLSAVECQEGGFKYGKWTGCSSECQEKNQEFNSATKRCEWKMGFQPEEVVEEVVRPPVFDPVTVPQAVLPSATRSNCDGRGEVGQAIGRFRDMVGLRCKQGAAQLTFGAIAAASILASSF